MYNIYSPTVLWHHHPPESRDEPWNVIFSISKCVYLHSRDYLLLQYIFRLDSSKNDFGRCVWGPSISAGNMSSLLFQRRDCEKDPGWASRDLLGQGAMSGVNQHKRPQSLKTWDWGSLSHLLNGSRLEFPPKRLKILTLARKWEGLLWEGSKATFLSGQQILRGLRSEVQEYLVLCNGNV